MDEEIIKEMEIILKEINAASSYQTKLLESIYEAINKKQNLSAKKAKFIQSISSMLNSNEVLKANPQLAILLSQMQSLFDEGEEI